MTARVSVLSMYKWSSYGRQVEVLFSIVFVLSNQLVRFVLWHSGIRCYTAATSIRVFEPEQQQVALGVALFNPSWQARQGRRQSA